MTGTHADDRWKPPSSGSPEAILESIDDAAVWIKQRLKSSGSNPKFLPVLCLDTNGAVCTWTKPEDCSAELIDAAIDQLDHDEDSLDGGYHSTIGERFPSFPLEVNYQPLSTEQTSEGSRSAVVAAPDIPARLLIDQLDSIGVRVGRVESFWNIIARGWDPGTPHRAQSRASQRVILTDDPVCGCMIVDPDQGRVNWTWSKEGDLVAAGSLRIGVGPDGPIMHREDLSRLCADWLGWASQLGIAPSRIVAVLPEQTPGLDRNQISAAFAAHWPTATTDVLTQEDPILATLRTIHEYEPATQGGHSDSNLLTNRPGRSHRSMYRWAALALIIAGGGIGWIAWTLYAQGSNTAQQARSVRSEMNQQIMTLQPPIADRRLPTAELQARLNRLTARSGPMEVRPTKPILEELETISFVLGISGIEIQSIQLSSTYVKVQIRASDLALTEQISEALRSINGSNLQWLPSPELVKRGEQIEATFTGVWDNGSST